MRSERKRKEREEANLKGKKKRKNRFCKRLSIIYCILLVLFVALFVILDVLPPALFGIVIALLLLATLFIAPVLYSDRGIPARKRKAAIVACVLIFFFVVADYYMASTMIFLKDISNYIETGIEDRSDKHLDVTEKTFNILVSGIDVTGDINESVSRSDVNMVVTVNPQRREVLITSIPRDYYIELPTYGAMDKLTHTGIYGAEETIAAVESLLNIEINYYAKVNYTTITGLVDAIGGIDIISPYSFDTHGMSVHYHFDEGENHLDGSHALAYCRERQSWVDGDLKRNENQQLVLEAIIKKVTKGPVILLKYTSILDAVKGTVETDMSSDEMTELIKMQLADMRSWKITKQAIKGESDMAMCFSLGDYASVVMVDEASVNAATEAIEKITY